MEGNQILDNVREVEIDQIPNSLGRAMQASEVELEKILAGKPITDKIDKAYMNSIVSRLHQETLKDWAVKSVSLTSKQNLMRLSLY